MKSHLVAGKMLGRTSMKPKRRSTTAPGMRHSTVLRVNSAFMRALQNHVEFNNGITEGDEEESSADIEMSTGLSMEMSKGLTRADTDDTNDKDNFDNEGKRPSSTKNESITQSTVDTSDNFNKAESSRLLSTFSMGPSGRTFSDNMPSNKEELKALVNAMINERNAVELFDALGDDAEKEFDNPFEEEMHTPFAENIYTLFYMCAFRSYAFWYAIFVYCIQIATISLTMANVIDVGSADNPLAIPPMVDLTVTCTQAITLMLSLAYQSDLIESLLKLQDGFYPEVLLEHPGADFWTWCFSVFAQLCAGLLLLLTIFILTMQVDNVLSIMTNFAALHFMAEIDDIGFAMAKLGFIRTQLQKEAEAVVNFQVPLRRRRNITRRILYLLALLGLYFGYGILKKRQLDGYYLQTHIYVQFGDAHDPTIPYYSGIFASRDGYAQNHRIYHDVETNTMSLAYCYTEGSWTFSKGSDPCKYFAKSSSTGTFDVTSIPDSAWKVVDANNKTQPFDTFSLVGRDCDPESCRGKCVEGLCECPHDLFGIDCEFSNVCPELITDKRFTPFPVLSHSQWAGDVSHDFELLKTGGEYVKVYNMPVYYSSRTYPANVIFFSGGRWVLTSELDLFDLDQARKDNPSRQFFPELTAETLENEFHGHHQATYTPFMLSDPVGFDTTDFRPTPAGLSWWTVQSLDEEERMHIPEASVDTLLTCKACLAEQGGCHSEGGVCNHITGNCDCSYGYEGNRCELQKPCFAESNPCGGNGVCDEVSGVCKCDFPFHGKLCHSRFHCSDENGRGVCQNDGVCDSTSGHCQCQDPAIYGDACEKKADCNTLGCENGGLCSATGECICRPPFVGRLCHMVDTTMDDELFCSKDEDCKNGSCNNSTGFCSCEDPSAFGNLCQHQFNCGDDWYNCLNGGECNAASGICECPESHFGPDCSKVEPCYADEDCGSEPIESTSRFQIKLFDESPFTGNRCDVDTGLCHCNNGPAAGKKCERDTTHDCRFVGCAAGGVCNKDGHCECPSPYSGLYCEAIIGDLPVTENLFRYTPNEMRQGLEECLEQWDFPPYTWIIEEQECQYLLENSYERIRAVQSP